MNEYNILLKDFADYMCELKGDSSVNAKNLIYKQVDSFLDIRAQEEEANRLEEERKRIEYEKSDEYRANKINGIVIEDLNLSVRAYNCLKAAKINTLGQIPENAEECLRFRNFGYKSVAEISVLLKKYNIEIVMSGETKQKVDEVLKNNQHK